MNTNGHRSFTEPGTPHFRQVLPAAIAALLAAPLWTAAAVAQEASATDQNDYDLTIEEVIVTASKREAIAQDLPMALTALPQSFLEQQNITKIDDLSDYVAGLQIVNTQPGRNTIAIRGVTSLGGETAPVGYYIDEAPVSSFQIQPDLAMWDLERIEVLRGPQGTLFGDGSMAGTIRAITNKPNPDGFEGRVFLQDWDYKHGGNSYDLKGMVNIPLSETFAVRALAGYKSDGGWIDVPEAGLTDANDYDQTTARVAARWLPTDNLVLDLSWDHNDLDMNRDNLQTSPGVYDPLTYLPPGYPIPKERNDWTKIEYDLYNLTIDWALDNFTVVSASSYYDQSWSNFTDLNEFIAAYFFGAPVAPFLPDSNAAQIVAPGSGEDAFTQEIRLVSNGDEQLDWTVGAFYKDRSQDVISGFDLHVNMDLGLLDPSLAGVVIPIADELSLPTFSASSTQWAFFGEIDYQLADSWNLIAGLRYFSDDNSQVLDEPGSAVFGTVPGIYTAGGSDSTWAPKLTLSWQTSDTTSVYFNVAKGFRSGFANTYWTFNDEIPQSYGPETLWTYEAGIKASPRPNLITNFYVYYNDWTDLQLALVTTDGLLGYTSNAGSADATGAEFEMTWLPTEGLTLSANVAYVDAKIQESVFTAGDVIEVASKGNSIPFVPDWTGAITADYVHPLGDSWNLRLNGNYAYRGSNYSDPYNSDNQKNDAYGTLNARIGLEAERWGVYLFGRNITDEHGTSLIRQPVGSLTDIVFYNYIPPQTWGVELQARF